MLGIAEEEGRIILTRDISLAGDNVVYFVSENLWEQLALFFRLYEMPPGGQAFSRCIMCNECLGPVSREEVREKVPPYVYENGMQLLRCPSCGRIYWEGSHYRRMKEKLEEISGQIVR